MMDITKMLVENILSRDEMIYLQSLLALKLDNLDNRIESFKENPSIVEKIKVLLI